METVIGQLLALLTAACFATSALVWSYSGKRIGSTRVTHIRLWFALPAVLLVHLLFFGTPFPFHLETGAYVFFALSGLCGFALADLFIFKSLVVLGARETLVILTLSPLFGTLVSWFSLSEKISVMEILGIIVIILGVMWVVYEEGRNRAGDGPRKATGVVSALMQMSPIILLPVDRFIFKRHITLKTVCATCLAIAGAVLLFVY